MMPPSKTSPERVLVAMSGGVDSTLTAALLAADPRYEPVGLTLRLWDCGPLTDGGVAASCCGQDGAQAARGAAASIGIRHYVIDGREPFRREVLEPAWRDYASGRTPNPCLQCNSAVKWRRLQEMSTVLDASWIATGHYARIGRHDPGGGGSALLRGVDPAKDQSYFLFALTPAQLAMTLFPLGGMTKVQARQEARKLALPNAERPDSQDACLGGDGVAFPEALRTYLEAEARPGQLVDPGGRVLGRHDGVHRFTIGQRKGLGVATGQRAYVTAIRPDRAEVVLSTVPGDLESSELHAAGVRWHIPPPEQPLKVQAQIRYRHKAAPATVELTGEDSARVTFEAPQRAITPGQAVVFYDGERVLGGGWIV